MDIPKKRPAKIGMWSIENSAGFYVRWWSQLVHRKQRNDRVWKTGRCALWKTTSSQGYQDISRISMDISQPWFKSHQSEKNSCNVSLWGYLSFAYLWLATFNMKCIVRLLEAPMDSWNFMETPEVSQNGATPSHYMSLVSILSHGHP